MLTPKENAINIAFISFFSHLNFYPIKVYKNSDGRFRIQTQPAEWRRINWTIWLVLSCIDCIFVAYRLHQCMQDPSSFTLTHFPLHVQLFLCAVTAMFWHFNSFYVWPSNTVAILNFLFELIDQGTKHEG